MQALASTLDRFGDARAEFTCCETTFIVRAGGLRADAAVSRARTTAKSLEVQLNAFAPASAVSALNRDGEVTNAHVARVARRGLEYYDRTAGVFDIRQGQLEHDLKAFLREERDSIPRSFDTGSVRVDGDRVATDVPLDLNGLAKGYIVDRSVATLTGPARRGFVSGGGDLSPPTGPVGVENPYGEDFRLKTLETDWHIATSGGYRRERDGHDHIYNPKTAALGSRHDSVTVVARRDCMEADALATTLAALSLADAQALAADWQGLEALIVHDGVFHPTDGFHHHVADP